jgi:general secretion pathway protein E
MTTPSTRRPAAPPPVTGDGNDLLQILMFRKALTREQAERVRRHARGGIGPLVQAIVKMGFATEAQVSEALAQFAGLPFVKINPLELDLEIVTGALSGPFARKHGLVALAKTDEKLTVAIADPFAPFPADDIKRVTGLLAIERVVATRSDIEAIHKTFYDLKSSLKTAEKQLSASSVPAFDISNQEFLSGEAEELDPASGPVVKALDQLLGYAFEQRASDIHFEPKRNVTLVRLRIDGMLHDVHVIPKIVYQALISRVKLLSGCNIAEKRRPQDGRIKREQNGREIELRVSTLPTAFGEKAVLRIFDPDVLLKGIDELGFSAADLEAFQQLITHTHGIILVTGPTGSGKTTTLYSVLKHLAKPEVNIVTIEDPIEMVHEDFNQVAVRPAIDLTFGNALRTVLRQDPDIIMVGEIRDQETAENAVQAALTGHLVLSTLHTNDAPSSVTRLLDLGIPHFLILSTVIGIVAQRLVRVNCRHCSGPFEPTDEEAVALGIALDELRTHTLKRGAGCVQCRQTGYAGRDGVFQVMPISEGLRGLIGRQSPSPEIFAEARAEGMRTLREAAIEKVLQGETTVAEMVRVTGVARSG